MFWFIKFSVNFQLNRLKSALPWSSVSNLTKPLGLSPLQDVKATLPIIRNRIHNLDNNIIKLEKPLPKGKNVEKSIDHAMQSPNV
jgi:hypothetical protein